MDIYTLGYLVFGGICDFINILFLYDWYEAKYKGKRREMDSMTGVMFYTVPFGIILTIAFFKDVLG